MAAMATVATVTTLPQSARQAIATCTITTITTVPAAATVAGAPNLRCKIPALTAVASLAAITAVPCPAVAAYATATCSTGAPDHTVHAWYDKRTVATVSALATTAISICRNAISANSSGAPIQVRKQEDVLRRTVSAGATISADHLACSGVMGAIHPGRTGQQHRAACSAIATAAVNAVAAATTLTALQFLGKRHLLILVGDESKHPPVAPLALRVACPAMADAYFALIHDTLGVQKQRAAIAALPGFRFSESMKQGGCAQMGKEQGWVAG